MATDDLLAAGAAGPGHPFADPARTQEDVEVLHELTAVLAAAADAPGRTDGWRHWTNRLGTHRLLVPSWARLAAASSARGVGFFGQLRPADDDTFPPTLEPRVAEAGAREGWLLAYLNVRFAPAPGADAPRYGNLVVLTDREAAIATLDGCPEHVEAVERSPGAYRSLRIHRLVLDGAPLSLPPLRVTSTLYRDYATTPPWGAVRVGDG